MYAYSDPSREGEPTALPDIEVFQMTAREVAETMEDEIHEFMRRPAFRLAATSGRTREMLFDAMVEELEIQGGWYWHACFPGCLPDDEPVGPFATHEEALDDARAMNDA